MIPPGVTMGEVIQDPHTLPQLYKLLENLGSKVVHKISAVNALHSLHIDLEPYRIHNYPPPTIVNADPRIVLTNMQHLSSPPKTSK
jgi:hypothetical protein